MFPATTIIYYIFLLLLIMDYIFPAKQNGKNNKCAREIETKL